MLKTFAAGLLATALIAGPAFAQNSTSSASGPAPAATTPAKTPSAASANTMTVPAATNAKQTANSGRTTKHVKLHKKAGKHTASRSHVKSGKMHQARHVKSHQDNTGAATKRS
jgi:hypothetical protein